jgi:hypothetical protein
MGALEVAATEEEGVFAAIQGRTRRAANPIPQLVTHDRAENARKPQPAKGEYILASEDARGNEKGIAGKEEADEKPGLHKDDKANERGSSPAD